MNISMHEHLLLSIFAECMTNVMWLECQNQTFVGRGAKFPPIAIEGIYAMKDANLRTMEFRGSQLATHKQLMPSISPAKLLPRARVNRPEIGKGPQLSAHFLS